VWRGNLNIKQAIFGACKPNKTGISKYWPGKNNGW
jgi:hypothetical protein